MPYDTTGNFTVSFSDSGSYTIKGYKTGTTTASANYAKPFTVDPLAIDTDGMPSDECVRLANRYVRMVNEIEVMEAVNAESKRYGGSTWPVSSILYQKADARQIMNQLRRLVPSIRARMSREVPWDTGDGKEE